MTHRGRLRRGLVAALAAAVALPSTSFAARARPIDATVLVRIIGHVRVFRGEDERAWRERLLDLPEVEVGIGSGFIISPEGWVITNHHVVSSEKRTVLVQGQTLEVSVSVTAIEVVLPAVRGQPERRFAASVYAVDEALDLAILRVSADGLPYAALGDSDAARAGEPVTAVGYPFGGLLEIDRPRGAGTVPGPSVTVGAISALRGDASGDRRHLQVSTVLNPGNSGGPIADGEGYVVGVAQARLEKAADIGFAIPINRVKGLLQAYGLDAILPVTLHVAGGAITAPGKGLRLATPVGFDDRSRLRLRVDAATTAGRASRVADAAEDEIALRIDRLATEQSVEAIERTLLTDGVFERFSAGAPGLPSQVRSDGRIRVLAGHASGTQPLTGAPLKMVHIVMGLGKEAVVARYVGTADTVAANRSILQSSLASLEVTRLLSDEVTRPLAAAWDVPRRVDVPLATPRGWVVEPGEPWACAPGLPPADAGFAMSPTGDFTVVLRAGWRAMAAAAIGSAARGCSSQPGVSGGASYATAATLWGLAYHVEGVFVPGADGVWQLEMIVPAGKRGFITEVFRDWVATVTK